MTTLSNILKTSSSEDLSIDIVALITSAANDDTPKYTLSEIRDALKDANVVQHLDPLNALPSLLPCPDPAAQEIIGLMRADANAKEIVIAVEESLERLHRTALEDGDDEDDEATDNRPNSTLPLSEQILRLLGLLKGGHPQVLAKQFDTDSGRASILASAELVNEVVDWAEKKEGISTEETKAYRNVLTEFIFTALPSLSSTVKSSLSARAFSLCFPRLAFREVIDPTWKTGDQAMQAMVSAYLKVEGTATFSPSLLSPPNQALLILYAHWLMKTADESFSSSTTTKLTYLEVVFPVILQSIQTNHFLEETLSILLLSLHHLQLSKNSAIELSPDLIHPLCTLLPHLAGAHPEPQVRHRTFRVLGMVLKSSPALVRMQVLRELTGPSEQNQESSNDDLEAIEEARRQLMRIAAIGLVKEAIMEALQESASSDQSAKNPFVTPRFLQTFGPILFRTQPEDYFETLSRRIESLPEKEREQEYLVSLNKELEGEAELTRLVECLSLLYVLLLRDGRNLTGLRDKDNVANIERTLLAPIRRLLETVFDVSKDGESEDRHAQLHSVMPLVALKLGIERLDDASRDLGLKSS
ncbi:hypothetical protein D9758_001610 [Tetrapyrgos nigripes]|uniref:Uncharacterized protein n=1 Tax=Tetrapyrgos nigripes TaxID=182062 RepID=A0A8H5GXG3_9AGAR|nr:hypothetical protein D9758_001610 [Tetrapyrgos nigripes]